MSILKACSEPPQAVMMRCRPSPFLARISNWPRGLGFELGKDGGRLAFGLDAAFGGFGGRVDLDASPGGLGRGLDGAPFRFDPLRLGDGAGRRARPPRCHRN